MVLTFFFRLERDFESCVGRRGVRVLNCARIGDYWKKMTEVILHIYDVTNSGSDKTNNTIVQINKIFKDGIGLGGIFHSAVQVLTPSLILLVVLLLLLILFLETE